MCPNWARWRRLFPCPWSTHVRLLSVRTADARAFYETEALQEGWSVLYERLALSRNKAALLMKAVEQQPGDRPTPEQAIRDPFVLDPHPASGGFPAGAG
jgi:predicted nuclease of restriction endonuclease-like (RecB) superfamily